MKLSDTQIINTIIINKKNQVSNGRIKCHKYSRLQIEKTSKILCKGKLDVGNKENRISKQETRLSMGKNSELHVNGNFGIGFGSDIRIFDNAKLT